jgi:hypothetical protein
MIADLRNHCDHRGQVSDQAPRHLEAAGRARAQQRQFTAEIGSRLGAEHAFARQGLIPTYRWIEERVSSEQKLSGIAAE